ncbi:MAG: phosphoglycerate kinase, partial [Solirubrobacterales bacterium]
MSGRAGEHAAPPRGSFAKASVRDAEVNDRTVLVRVDFNVPLEGGKVADDTRIRATLPTIELLRERGAALVLVSHLGRPGGPDPELSMAPVGRRLAELAGVGVRQAPEVVGDQATEMAAELGPGDLMLLENSRFEPGETGNDAQLAAALAELADLYVNDAFGAAHRAHATTAGVARHLPAYAGLLLEQEVRELTAVVEDPAQPLVVVLGGAKVSDKIGVIDRFLGLADEILIGGAMCFSFFRADGHSTGDSLVEEEAVEAARDALRQAEGSRCRLRLPTDLVLGDRFDADAERRESDSVEVPDGWMGLDVGP